MMSVGRKLSMPHVPQEIPFAEKQSELQKAIQDIESAVKDISTKLLKLQTTHWNPLLRKPSVNSKIKEVEILISDLNKTLTKLKSLTDKNLKLMTPSEWESLARDGIPLKMRCNNLSLTEE